MKRMRLRIITVFLLVAVLAGALLSFNYLNKSYFRPEAAAVGGALRIDSSNPHYFSDGTKPIYLAGVPEYIQAEKNVTSSQIHAAVDGLLNGSSTTLDDINYVRLWTILPWAAKGEVRFPWLEINNYSNGSYKFDLTKWDSTYWTNLKDYIGYAQTKGVYVDVAFFDECGLEGGLDGKTADWQNHPFYDGNNINQTKLSGTTGIPSSGQSFYSIWSETSYNVETFQKSYITKMITELAPYNNVVYELANEYERGSNKYEQEVAAYIKSEMSRLNSSSRVLTINHIGSLTPPWGDSNMNGYNFHLNESAAASDFARAMSGFYGRNIPIDCNECSLHMTVSQMRKIAFSNFVSGANFAFDDANESMTAPVWRFNKFLRGVTVPGDTRQGVNFWQMTPNNYYYKGPDNVEYVKSTPNSSKAFTLANKGAEYVVFLEGSSSSTGQMTIDLPNPGDGKEYRAVAFNSDPNSTTEYTNLTVPALGGASAIIGNIPSFGSSQVVYIRAINAGFQSTIITNPKADSNRTYQVAKLSNGMSAYIDRDYPISSIPSELAAQYTELIKTANDDKTYQESADPTFLSFTLLKNGYVYLIWDPNISAPNWMSGWEKRTATLSMTHSSGVKSYVLYRKYFNAGTVTLGPNNGGSTNSMYLVAAFPSAGAPSITITKSAAASSVNPGGTIVYTIKAKNIGQAKTTTAKITDNFNSTAQTLVSTNPPAQSAADPNNPNIQILTWQNLTLDVNQELTFIVTAKAK